MIVFDLACGVGDHRFEAWFASSRSYEEQRGGGLIACPVCGDTAVGKAVMAPRVAAKGNQACAQAPSVPDGDAAPLSARATDAQGPSPAAMRKMLAHIAGIQAEVLPRSRWVGREFDAAARAMHEGRADPDLIHGQVSPTEAQALHDDGVAAMPLLVPFVPPDLTN